MGKKHEKFFVCCYLLTFYYLYLFSSGNDFTYSFREPIFNRVAWLIGLFQQIRWEKMMMYFDSLLFKIRLLKPYAAGRNGFLQITEPA